MFQMVCDLTLSKSAVMIVPNTCGWLSDFFDGVWARGSGWQQTSLCEWYSVNVE